MIHHSEGLQGGILGFTSVLGMKVYGMITLGFVITGDSLGSTVFYAAIGSTVGFFVHLALKSITAYIKKLKK